MAPTASRFLIAGLAALLASACATGPEAVPDFDANASLDAQVDTFIEVERSTRKRIKSVQTLAVTSCNVLFALKSSATASTGGGLFSSAGNTSRAEAKVSQIYSLEGVGDAELQPLADQICADTEQRLAAAGFAVKPHAEVRANPHFAKFTASGKAAPFAHSIGNGDAKQEYRLFTRSGESVHGASYLGTAGGLMQAFKAVGSDSSWHHEARLMSDLGVDAVHLDVLVDFATMASSGQHRASQITSTNSAEVSGEARLAISGKLRIVPLADLKCWDRFGNHECAEIHDAAQVGSKLPVSGGEPFYESLVETTTTGDRVSSGLTKALSVISALGGVSGVSSIDVSRYMVTVRPEVYSAAAQRTTGQFFDLAILATRREAAR